MFKFPFSKHLKDYSVKLAVTNGAYGEIVLSTVHSFFEPEVLRKMEISYNSRTTGRTVNHVLLSKDPTATHEPCGEIVLSTTTKTIQSHQPIITNFIKIITK